MNWAGGNLSLRLQRAAVLRLRTGEKADNVRIDVYDSTGDYLASGIDGRKSQCTATARDQLGQIMKRGKLVIYGDVGQTFMYAPKAARFM